MKYLIPSLLTIALLWTACASEPFAPTHEPNPWSDDYSAYATFADSAHWGTYNVHDPAITKVGDTYYMYSTDAIYINHHPEQGEEMPKTGFLQMRRSNDLVNWEFIGWAFDSMPSEPVEWVKSQNNGHGPGNIWAPYMIPSPDGQKYWLYYCASAFGKKTSMIAMAEALSPEGPWTHVGSAVKTGNDTPMNAIDPTLTIDTDGRLWMTYGSYFGGIFCVELNPSTGLAKKEGDLGHLVARRANYRKDNLEAPEIIYNADNGQYYFFGSYDPLMTTYNVRAGRSPKAEGPYTDFHGKELADTTDNFPILTAPYAFEGHPGWAGTAHCGVFTDGNGRYFMAHQGRLAPHYLMMDLHLREMFFTKDGWPVVSPERYAGTPSRKFQGRDLVGEWEIIRVHVPFAERQTEAGQILWGEGALLDGECNFSEKVTFNSDGTTSTQGTTWSFDPKEQLLSLQCKGEMLNNLIIFAGHDWEKEQNTVLFTGLDSDGRSVWGKRVK